MLVIMDIDKEYAADMKERCETLSKINRRLEEVSKSQASKEEARKRARLYEAIVTGIDGACKEATMDATMEKELNALAEKHGTGALLQAIQQCFKDEEFLIAAKGFSGDKKDGEKMH
jgi:hypothetical protein